ncbi:MAG: DUF4136 domain-containing protein [Gammaproteobacteria bacterium]|nr:DUF4136 domain-containing protein [Gammaproteobacteria bacterium]
MNATNPRLALIATAAMALAGCASTPSVYSSQKPNVDFSSYETYGYVAQAGTDRPDAPTPLLTQFLKAAVDREMQALGFRYVAEAPDLLVNFFVETRERIESRPGPPPGPYLGFGYYSFRRGYYAGWRAYPQVEVSQYTEGTLNIDIADARQRELIWEGVAIGRVTRAARRDVQAAVDSVVPQIFAEFPLRAAR